MSKIGDNSIMKADELRDAIDARCDVLKTSIDDIQEVAVHAVLHVVAHGDTTFGTRIYQKLPKGVKSNDFKNWFEDHAGCEWDKASFKLVKGKAQTSDFIKLSVSLWYKYKRDTSAQTYDFAKACSNLAKAMVNEKKSPYVNGADSTQQDAVFQLISAINSAGFSVDPSFDSVVTKDAVSF